MTSDQDRGRRVPQPGIKCVMLQSQLALDMSKSVSRRDPRSTCTVRFETDQALVVISVGRAVSIRGRWMYCDSESHLQGSGAWTNRTATCSENLTRTPSETMYWSIKRCPSKTYLNPCPKRER